MPLTASVAEPVLKNARQASARPLFDGPIVRRAIVDSFKKLDPRVQVRNPVMFIVEVGALVTLIIAGCGNASPQHLSSDAGLPASLDARALSALSS